MVWCRKNSRGGAEMGAEAHADADSAHKYIYTQQDTKNRMRQEIASNMGTCQRGQTDPAHTYSTTSELSLLVSLPTVTENRKTKVF